MKRIEYLAVLLILLSACSLLKKSTKTSNESIDALKTERLSSVTNKQTSLSNGEQLSYRRDSAGADYRIYFWPKGRLNMGLGAGFSGEFDSVLFIGKQYQVSNATESSTLQEEKNNESARMDQQETDAQKLKKEEEKKSSYDPKMIALGIVLLLLAIFIAKKLLF